MVGGKEGIVEIFEEAVRSETGMGNFLVVRVCETYIIILSVC